MASQECLQSDHEMHEPEYDDGDNVERLASKLFAEGSCNERCDGKAQGVRRQPNRCLELRAIQVFEHGREPKIVCRCICRCGRCH